MNRAAAGEAAPHPAIVIHVVDCVHLPAGSFARTRTDVERVFQDAGVRVEWAVGAPTVADLASSPDASRRHLALVIVKQRLGAFEGQGNGADVMGEAALGVHRAYLYVERVLAATAGRPADTSLMLADVIVHEMGHLLLPPNSHSNVGIMRPNIDPRRLGFDRFTEDQSATIRARLLD